MENESINTNQNTEQQPTTPTPEASGDQGAEKLFTQADLDRIIGERLARERAKAEPSPDEAREADLKAREARLDCREYISAEGFPEALLELFDTSDAEKFKAAVQRLDDAEVPEVGRVLVATPATYALMKKCKDIVMETNVGNELRLKGVIGILDGMTVQKIPAVRLPAGFGFLVAHPCATVAPVKLEDYTIHENPPGISGSLVEGRICYDAFVLDNKAKAIYYQAQPVTTPSSGGEG